MKVDWDKLKRLHLAATRGEWEFQNSPSNEFVISGNAAICALPGVSSRKKDFKYIAAIHNAFPAILAEREAAMRLRDDVRVYRQQLRVENVVDNPSGAACSACRSTGCAHCCDPINCGGLKQMREPTREEWLVALRLLAAFDKEIKND